MQIWCSSPKSKNAAISNQPNDSGTDAKTQRNWYSLQLIARIRCLFGFLVGDLNEPVTLLFRTYHQPAYEANQSVLLEYIPVVLVS